MTTRKAKQDEQPRFGEYDLMADKITNPCRRVALVGNGWYIEVTPHDRGGLLIRCSGLAGAMMVVLPEAGNAIRVTSDHDRDARVHREAARIAEVWEENKKTKGAKP